MVGMGLLWMLVCALVVSICASAKAGDGEELTVESIRRPRGSQGRAPSQALTAP